MTKNKKAFTVTSLLATLMIGILASGSFSSSDILHIKADTVWRHYVGLDPTYSEIGAHEYWTDCAGTTLLYNPGGTIVEAGTLDMEYAESLPWSDDRKLDVLTRTYDFEDGVVPHHFKKGPKVTSFTINDTEGVNGSKCLQVNISGSDYFFGLTDVWLEYAFSDSSIEAVAFDAKATKQTNNFRSGAGVCLEENTNGYGLYTTYKTFYYTREMYENWVPGGYMFKGGGLTSSDKVYLDNFRYCTYDGSLEQVTFDVGLITTDSSGNKSIRGKTGQAALVSGAGATAVDFSYNYKTQGNRSLHITKQNGYLAVFTNKTFYNSLSEVGMAFDIYITMDIAFTGNDNTAFYPYFNSTGNPKNCWQTYCLRKNQVGTDGRFLILQGSPAGEVYIDNIRPLEAFESFEDNIYTADYGEYTYASRFEIASETEGNKVRDNYHNINVMINGAVWTGAEVEKETFSNGVQSVRFDSNDKGYSAVFISPSLFNFCKNNGYAVRFDAYTNGQSFTGGTLIGNKINGACMNNWGTVTFSGSELDDPAVAGRCNGRISTAQFNGAGSFWIDNIRVVKLDS